jgi:hypothetical protein
MSLSQTKQNGTIFGIPFDSLGQPWLKPIQQQFGPINPKKKQGYCI